jgi:amino acid adenylation domain-containing protein
MNEENYIGKIPHQLFEEQVITFKDKIAVFTENKSMTYDKLNKMANRLAYYLTQKLSIKPGDTVGVCTQHEPERVLSLIAIAKAGAIYVPIDPNYPSDLINYMTDKIEAKFILANRRELLDRKHELTALAVDLTEIDYARYATENLSIQIPCQKPLYIIFTSGSTGRPKAVAVSHRAAHNHFAWIMDYTAFTPSDIWLQTINPSFDPSMHELIAPLMVGGSIALIGGIRKLDSREITDAIIRHQATHITTVPTMLTLLVNTPNFSSCRSLKHVCVGGEVFRPALASKAMEHLRNTQFHNVYGPTEATIMASGWKIAEPENKEALPIGPAIYNMKFYLQTDSGKMIEITPNTEGQLCISGISLANCYVNDEALTNEKFTLNPLAPTPQSIYRRLYFSGDRCRVDEQGNIFCLGRLDDQVKINGQRVELAEVEYQFSTIKNVNDVAALLIDGDLIVALVPSETSLDQAVWLNNIRQQVEKKLPAFMLPKRIKIIDTIPRQAVSAKADRKKLIEILSVSPIRPNQGNKSVKAPVSIEETIAMIMAEVTANNVDQFNDVDTSFADLGIDSIDLQMLTLKLGKQYNLDIRTEDLFEYYTIKKLASFIENHTAIAV